MVAEPNPAREFKVMAQFPAEQFDRLIASLGDGASLLGGAGGAPGLSARRCLDVNNWRMSNFDGNPASCSDGP